MTDEFQLAVGRTALVLVVVSSLAVIVVGARRVGIATGIVAGLTWLVGSACAFLASAHLVGVIWTAYRYSSFSWNFRFASLLLVGLWLILAGVLCVAAASEVFRGRPPDWRRAASGALLLALVAGPLVPVQAELAGGVVTLAVTDLVAIIGFLAGGWVLSRGRLTNAENHSRE
jgi:hypothetical protein